MNRVNEKSDKQSQAETIVRQPAATYTAIEDRRQVVVDILATAMVDILLQEHSCAQGNHVPTC